jgi:hypothetical protein
MYRVPSRTTSAPGAMHQPGDRSVVVELRKKSGAAADFDRRDRDEENEALLAALSLGAVFLTVVTSLIVKLWLG